LKEEGCKITVGSNNMQTLQNIEKIVYTEAVPKTNPELEKAKILKIKIQTYPEALAEIVNSKKLIAIS
jgi:UDP-N-acetylmuramate-alanine ligase